jgi:hypothetical protein
MAAFVNITINSFLCLDFFSLMLFSSLCCLSKCLVILVELLPVMYVCKLQVIKNESVSQNSHVRLQASSNKKGFRGWDKRHFCLYCGKSSTKITKHLLRQHIEEG